MVGIPALLEDAILPVIIGYMALLVSRAYPPEGLKLGAAKQSDVHTRGHGSVQGEPGDPGKPQHA
jgi:hypothetical protein